MLKELPLHAAPYVAWDWLPAYQRRTFASLPWFLPLSLYLFAASLKLTLSCSTSELHTYFLTLSSCFSFCPHPPIFNKCPVKFYFYLALGAEDINECSRIFICCQYSQLYAFYIQTFKRHKSEIVEPAAMLGPPLCIIDSYFCLSDYSACLGYQRVEWQMQVTENTCATCIEINILNRKKMRVFETYWC